MELVGDAMVRLRLTFSGQVQSMGLRSALVKYGTRKHITGVVRNDRDDPTLVYAELQGDEKDIQAALRSTRDFFANGAQRRSFEIAARAQIPVVEGETTLRVEK